MLDRLGMYLCMQFSNVELPVSLGDFDWLLLQVDIQFTDEAIREIARVAAYVNKTVENIGARRLHTVLERIVEVRSLFLPV